MTFVEARLGLRYLPKVALDFLKAYSLCPFFELLSPYETGGANVPLTFT